MKDFLSEFIKPKQGEVVDESGNILGLHMGAYAFTVGQRHGLGIGGGKPYFVYKIDTKSNKVFVTTDEHADLLNKKDFKITDCVWWSNPANHKDLTVKVRYRSEAIKCKISGSNDDYAISLNKTERAITPGQSAVLYDGDEVVGGGVIL